jgi:hypothetical protein
MNTRNWLEDIRKEYPDVTPEQWSTAIEQNSLLIATIEALTEIKRLYTDNK